MKKILSLFLLLNACLLSAQNYADKAHYLVDSLDINELSENDMMLLDQTLMQYHASGSDTLKVVILNDLCNSLNSHQRNKYLQFQYDFIVQLASNKPELSAWCKKHEAIALAGLAEANTLHTKDSEKGIQLLKKSIVIQKEIRDFEGLSQSYLKLGKLYAAIGDERTALGYYLKGLKLCERVKDNHAAANCRIQMGQSYLALENLDQALDQYEKARSLNEQLQNNRGLATAHNCLGKTHHYAKRYVKAIEHYQSALALYKQANDDASQSGVLKRIGKSQLAMKEADNAATFFTESLALSEAIGNNRGIAEAKLGLAQSALLQNEYTEAEELALAAHDQFKQLGLLNHMAKSHAVLSKVYEKQENTSLAFEHYKSFVHLHDSLMNFKQHQSGYSNGSTELLTKVEQPNQNSEASEKWTVKRLGIMSGAISLSLLILILIGRRTLKKKR